ncbi:MAG: hypothetical protein HYR73_09175 [Candidatus Eisenbacteria bacterium]|nr:hypothetical protein [Candidatus Eisenbacteria bacterium]
MNQPAITFEQGPLVMSDIGPSQESGQARRLGMARQGMPRVRTILAWLVPAIGLLIAWQAASAPAVAQSRSAEGCTVDHISVDTAGADTGVDIPYSTGAGQTVLVGDTVVTGMTVWRLANQSPYPNQARLFIKGVGSITGEPTGPLFYAGPVLTAPSGDGIHPIPWTFPIDPPVALPGPGEYFFDINDARCFGVIWLLANSKNPYRDGNKRKTGCSSCNSTGTGSPSSAPDSLDLVFDITFCANSTPARNTTWGRLKLRYK